MKITPIKTHKITSKDNDLFKILDKYLPKLKEETVVAVTSKIVSITEGRTIKIQNSKQKEDLIKKESQYYLPKENSKYDVSLTITNGILTASSGIDESNSNGDYVLWPKNPQESANKIREYLCKKFGLKYIGVIITDSKTSPLRWGVTAQAISYSGFSPLKNYIGKKDLFGRKFIFEKLSIIDGLATSSALVMGEGSEQTPIAIIENAEFVSFQNRNPNKKELSSLKISIEDDLYAPLLTKAGWKKGGK